MKSQLIKSFKNKNGMVTWGVNLNNDGSFSFISRIKGCYTVTREQLAQGWWKGTIPLEVRTCALDHK